jgi:PAS domain S-box-containing protein
MPNELRANPNEATPAAQPGASDSDELLALRAIAAGTASAVGPDFFRSLVEHLAKATGTKYAFIAEFLGGTTVRTHAYWFRDRIVDNVEFDLRGTPCEDVVFRGLCHHPTGVAARFPQDKPLIDLKIESYLGVPLRDQEGRTLGHLAVFDDLPMPEEPRRAFIFRIFAERATAEWLRLRAEKRLQESEDRFRDLFDEAPIAYVHEGLDTRFIRANKAALRAFGISAEQVEGTYGTSFIVDNPDNQRRLREAFESVGRGADTSGVVLELRRRDDGKPLWIQWWSRPDPGGTYTRTMFIDITDKVLLEQERAKLQAQNKLLREEISSAHNFGEIVGDSAPLVRVLQNVERVAPTDSTVLIQGETGTGKELVARAIHDRSARRSAPFVKVNCAALPAGLVESEFFGHEKGAFTGAVAARRGRFELADGGTIFLDEVGEVSPEVQVKLLRVLQESEFERVGGTQTIRVNVRVVAATNRDLAADVKAGRFRADLFYRLNVFPIGVPPLRERAADIPVLASYFVTQLAAGVGKRFESIDAETMTRLAAYAWPGNIRELRNVLERAVILCQGPTLRVESTDLGAAGEVPPTTAGAPSLSLEDVERRHILDVLKQTNGAIGGPAGAAKILGLPPSTLRSRMERLGIKG